METRDRKKHRVDGVCSQDDFFGLDSSQSEDVVCSLYVVVDSSDDKSNSNVPTCDEVGYVSFSFVIYFYVLFNYFTSSFFLFFISAGVLI